MEILYEAQLLLAMKLNERKFTILSSACHGDANWYISFSQIKGKINKNDFRLYLCYIIYGPLIF